MSLLTSARSVRIFRGETAEERSPGGSGLARALDQGGADALVAGTSVFRGGPDHYAANIAALRG